jgi:hypothetical protein
LADVGSATQNPPFKNETLIGSRRLGPVVSFWGFRRAASMCVPWSLGRTTDLNLTADRRGADIWIWAGHPGDAKCKSIVPQMLVNVPAFNEGAEQPITFPEIPIK